MKPISSRALVLVLALAGCADDFQPRSLLADLRVLAIEASPIDVAPGQEVTLRPTVFVPAGQTLTALSWKFCPLSLGSQAGFACLAPQCEFPLAPSADGSVTANPTALALQCAQALAAGDGERPQGSPDEVPSFVETVFTLDVATDAGESRQAAMRIKVWTSGGPPAPNRSPALRRLELDGVEAIARGPAARTVKPDQAVEVRALVDPASLDSYLDASGAERTEDPVVSFYATAGRFEGDRTSGVDGRITWTAEPLAPGTTEALLWLVVRDLRGGESVAGPFTVAIAAP